MVAPGPLVFILPTAWLTLAILKYLLGSGALVPKDMEVPYEIKDFSCAYFLTDGPRPPTDGWRAPSVDVLEATQALPLPLSLLSRA